MQPAPPIAFEEFMRRALYDPQRGYYSRRIPGIGRGGDFTTAPMLSESLARGIAAWAARALRETGCRDLIEIGPGEGRLAAAVLRHLPWHVRWKTRLHLVETSAPLAEIQKKQLVCCNIQSNEPRAWPWLLRLAATVAARRSNHFPRCIRQNQFYGTLGRRARWHESPSAALAVCQGKAVIFSNELVDAFPVRLFEKSTDGWREVAVAFDSAGTATESHMSAASLPMSSGFCDKHPPGQRIEVHDSYRRWLSDWLPLWKSGRMLTIDYGSTAETLYQRRPLGTLRGYLLQQRMEGAAIYQNPGRQDLTADVNFTDLLDWSAPWTCGNQLQTLAVFLRGFHDPQHPADRELCDENGAGGAFMVLDQQCRGSENPHCPQQRNAMK